MAFTALWNKSQRIPKEVTAIYAEMYINTHPGDQLIREAFFRPKLVPEFNRQAVIRHLVRCKDCACKTMPLEKAAKVA